MHSAIVKAACIRVVPETYRRAMETQVDVDEVEPHNLEDKVLAFIRNNTSGAAPKDIEKHCTRTNIGTRSWQFQPEYHVKLTRRVGQLYRPE